jgi:cell division septum initiation protein DivIVA
VRARRRSDAERLAEARAARARYVAEARGALTPEGARGWVALARCASGRARRTLRRIRAAEARA